MLNNKAYYKRIVLTFFSVYLWEITHFINTIVLVLACLQVVCLSSFSKTDKSANLINQL